MLDRRVYLMNLPYDASLDELDKLVSQFAEVDYVQIPRDKRGLPRGNAYVFLKNKDDVDKVIEYVDGRHIRSR